MEENAHSALDQEDYEERYTVLAERYETIKKVLVEIDEKRLGRRAKRENTVAFIKKLEQRDVLVAEFDEELWNVTIEKVVVHSDKQIIFIFKDGMELVWNI